MPEKVPPAPMIRTGWAQCRALALCFRIRHFLLLRSRVCGICRAIWLEIRTCLYLDWGLEIAVLGSLLAWVAMGRRTRVMTHHLEVATMPDFFGKRYDSNVIKITASVIAFVFLIPYTASVYNGLSRLFGMAFDIPYTVCVVTMAVLTGIYVILGGYMATAINDFIQGIIMIFGISAVVAAVFKQPGAASLRRLISWRR